MATDWLVTAALPAAGLVVLAVLVGLLIAGAVVALRRLGKLLGWLVLLGVGAWAGLTLWLLHAG